MLIRAAAELLNLMLTKDMNLPILFFADSVQLLQDLHFLAHAPLLVFQRFGGRYGWCWWEEATKIVQKTEDQNYQACVCTTVYRML